jgi:hypothetical protein
VTVGGLHSLGLPRSWRRAAAWLTIAVCLVPLSAGWFLGAWAASGLFVGATLAALRGRLVWGIAASDLGLGILFLIPVAGAGLGVAALWSALLPRALGRPPVPVRCWQLLGLRLGSLVSAVMLAMLLINDPLSRWSHLVWLLVLTWSLVAARCLSGESHQWLLIPWRHRAKSHA